MIAQIPVAAEHEKWQILVGGGTSAHHVADGCHFACHIRLASPFERHQVIMHRALAGVVDQIVDHRRLCTALDQRAAFDIMRPNVAVKQDAGRIVMNERAFAMLALWVAGIGKAFGR